MADENLFYWIAFNLLGQNFLACIDQVVIKLLGAALSNICVVSHESLFFDPVHYGCDGKLLCTVSTPIQTVYV